MLRNKKILGNTILMSGGDASQEHRREIVNQYVSLFIEMHPFWAPFMGEIAMLQSGTEGNEAPKLPAAIYPDSMSNVNIRNKRYAQIRYDDDLFQSDIKKSLLCGTVFGDCSFNINVGSPLPLKTQSVFYRTGTNARIQNKHSTRQFDWFLWKWLVALRQFVQSGRSAIQFSFPDGYQVNSTPFPQSGTEGRNTNVEVLGKLKIATNASESLTKMHSLLCPNNKKKFQRFWLNAQNNYFLMGLWLDDGSLTHQRQGEFCLDLFPAAELEILRDSFSTVWKFETVVRKISRTYRGEVREYSRLFIVDQENLLIFLRLVAPIVPVHSMLYKIMFVPANNVDLLQRWATEVSGLVLPGFREYVRDHYNKIIENYDDYKKNPSKYI
jgi:hypothetical protein